MEEQQQIQVEVFNQIHHLNRQDFITFRTIVTQNDFKDIKIPFDVIDSLKIKTLNVMLYFVISVQKNLCIFPSDHLEDKYRKLCAKQISEYYIKNHFVVEEYQFSFLVSKTLGYQVEQCAHIIYYLIYARFASHPYINSLCSKNNDGLKKKTLRKDHCSLKNIKKRTINRQPTQNQFQFQRFKKDLKTALKSQNDRPLRKNDQIYGRDKIKQENPEKNMSITDRSHQNNVEKSNTFIPQRINAGDNSSIFKNVQFGKKFYQSLGGQSCKGMMRKQKFDQFFDIDQLKIRAKLRKSPFIIQQNKQNFNKNVLQQNKNLQQISKTNYDNFKTISLGLKTKSATLDRVRTECSSRGHKFNFDKQGSETLQQTLQKLAQFENDRSKDFKVMNRRVRQNLQQRNLAGFQSYQQKASKNKISNSQQKGIYENKNQSPILAIRHFECMQVLDEDKQERQCAVNLLRNQNFGVSNQKQDDRKMEQFTQNTMKFRTITGESKLQKYKTEYRKFMNTQTLDRIKHSY